MEVLKLLEKVGIGSIFLTFVQSTLDTEKAFNPFENMTQCEQDSVKAIATAYKKETSDI